MGGMNTKANGELMMRQATMTNGEHVATNRLAGVSKAKESAAAAMKVVTAIMTAVTPELAAAFMEKNHPSNRRRMPTVVARYAAEMACGAWRMTHEGIAFDWDGNLVDGQHRLLAVIKSGVTVMMLVFRDLDPECMAVINRGRNRTIAHALQCMGFDDANGDTVAVARAMLIGPGGNAINSERANRDSAVRGFIADHIEVIVQAKLACPKPYATSILRAVVARASYHTDEAILSRFGLAIADRIPAGEVEERDAAARRFSDQCRRGTGGGGTVFRVGLYRRWQNVLHKYVEGAPMAKVYECDKDLFPLPE